MGRRETYIDRDGGFLLLIKLNIEENEITEIVSGDSVSWNQAIIIIELWLAKVSRSWLLI